MVLSSLSLQAYGFFLFYVRNHAKSVIEITKVLNLNFSSLNAFCDFWYFAKLYSSV